MEFSINKEYANKYNKWREKEEYQKLRDRYGDVSGSDSSSSESEDEDAEGLTAQLEKDWLTTLAAIKSKNPKIYDKDVQFYHRKSDSSNETSDDEPSKKPDKPMYLKDYERKVMLEKGGKLSDEESSSGDESKDTDRAGYFEIQEEIRKSIIAADVSSDSEEEFFTKRQKTKQQLEKEESDYFDWLKGQKDELSAEVGEAGVELDPLKSYWNDPGLPEGEKFLRDYFLNKRFLEEDEGPPTYDDIVNFSEEEDQLEKEDTFEHKFNFRFEDPDPQFIKTYPRLISDTVRRKDTKRTDKRQEVKDRKQKDKDKQKEEIKQLKNLKRREIEDRISQLREITGEDMDITVGDLDGDFDPEAHDNLMKKVFSSDYYDQDCDGEKPTWSDEDKLNLTAPDYDDWAGGGEDGGDDSESDSQVKLSPKAGPSGVSSPNAGPSRPHSDLEDGDLTVGKRKQKKSKFQKVVEAKKPVFDPAQKSFSAYVEEYYRLDCEDVVGGQPCRFRYRNVVANDFGLSVDEVLSAKETELNRWVSLKRMSQYRTEEEEKIDVRIFDKKGQNVKKKLNVLPSLQESEEPADQPQTPKKRKRKRNKKRGREQPAESQPEEMDSSKAGAKKQKLNDSIPDVVKPANIANSNSSKQNSEKKSRRKKKKVKRKEQDHTEDRGFKSTTTEKVKLDSNKVKPDEVKVKTDKVKLNKKTDNKNKKKGAKDKKKKAGVLSEERLKAYGIDPKKFKYTHNKTNTS